MKENSSYKHHAEQVLLGYADQLDTKNNGKSALKAYLMCSRLFSTVQSFVKLANYYKQNKDVKSALANLKKAQLIEPENPVVIGELDNLSVTL